MADKIWEVSASGVESIRTLEKDLSDCIGQMEHAWGKLSDSYIALSDDLGIYKEPLAEAILLMEQVNDKCEEHLQGLMNRLEQYAIKIEEMIAGKDV